MPASGPTGTVQFQIDGSSAGPAVAVTNGTAAYSTATLAAGSHIIVAVYSGDDNFSGSTSPGFTQNVDGGALTAAILAVPPDPRNAAVSTVTINFSEAVTGVDASDFKLTRDGTPVSLNGLTALLVTPAQYTLDLSTVTALHGAYVLSLVAPDSNIKNATGVPLAVDAADAFTVHPWQNVKAVEDVNDDSSVGPIDVLLIIIHINSNGTEPISLPVGQSPFLDVNGDSVVTALDVLQVISFINLRDFHPNAGEAESSPGIAVDSPTLLAETMSSPKAAFRPPLPLETQGDYAERRPSQRFGGTFPLVSEGAEDPFTSKVPLADGLATLMRGGRGAGRWHIPPALTVRQFPKDPALDDCLGLAGVSELEESLDVLANDVANAVQATGRG